MSAFPKSTWRGKVFGSRQNSLAIPLITVRSRIAAWCRQGRSSMRRRAALTAGRDATPCIQRGMASVPRFASRTFLLCRIGHFHFAATSIRAGRSLLRDLSVEPLIRQKSLVVSRYGASFELPQGNLGAYRLKVIATSGGVVTVFLMISCAVWYFAHPRKVVASIPRSEPELAIFMKCDMTGLPVTVPPGGAIRVVPVNEKYIRSNGWGSYEVRNDGMKPMRWPDEKKLQAAKRQHDVGGFCYRCEISNHGRVGVLDVAVPVRFWFGNKGGEQNAVKFTPIVSPLDAGQTSTLFFVNDCPM